MRSILKYTTSIILLVSLLLGCSEDFLDEKSPNNLTTDNFWKSENDLFLGITSAYSALTHSYMWGPFEYEWVPLEFRSDEMESRSKWSGWPEMETFTLDNTIWEITSFWRMQYRVVARASQVYEAAETMEGITEDVRKQYMAEASFLRGMAYFRLLQNFRYPVFSDHFAKSEEDYFNTQPERSVIYEFVEQELKFAKENLPKYNPSELQTGRATAGAAAGFLGKTYLYQNKYAEAETEFAALINGTYGPYDLLDDFNANFDGTNENSEESLFQVQYGESSNNYRTTHSIAVSYGGWDECWPSDWLFEEMSSELDKDGNYDLRLFGTIFCNVPGSYSYYHEDTYQNVFADGIADAQGGTVLFTDKDGNDVYYNKLQGTKYLQPSELMVDGWRHGNNINYLRFADVLLMYAEALNEQGKTSQAYSPINRVRARANMVDLPSGLSKEQFRERIMHERAVELAFEMIRYNDLVRWDENGFLDMKQVMGNNNKRGIDNFQKNKHEYLPIPNQEVLNNTSIDPSKVW